MSSDPRTAIRRAMRARRRALSSREHRIRSEQLAERLVRTRLFRSSQHIALYLSNDGEPDLTGLVEIAFALGKRCYVPVLSPLFHNRLWFAPYQPGMPLLLNRFRIPEPDLNWHAMRPAWTLDMVLTPLVAFDRQGNRLGMGGGFYDRTFAYLNRRQQWRKPHLIGIAFGFQELEQLPCASWDVPLGGVVTDGNAFGAELCGNDRPLAERRAGRSDS